MIKSGKTTILATLFLGATLVGGTVAGAAPFSNMPTSVQSQATTNKTEAKKVEFLLGLGLGALIGGLFVHETDRYYNHSYHRHGYHGRRYDNGKYSPCLVPGREIVRAAIAASIQTQGISHPIVVVRSFAANDQTLES